MTYLLDTSTFLWAATGPGKLSSAARRVCGSATQTLIVSVVSLWENTIKTGTGRLRIVDPPLLTSDETIHRYPARCVW